MLVYLNFVDNESFFRESNVRLMSPIKLIMLVETNADRLLAQEGGSEVVLFG